MSFLAKVSGNEPEMFLLSVRSICGVSKEKFKLIGAMGCCGFGPAVDAQAIMARQPQ